MIRGMVQTLTAGRTPAGPFRPCEPVVLVDRKARKYMIQLSEELRFNLRGGILLGADVIGTMPGSLLHTSRGEAVRAYRPTLEEYVLLMPRGAQIVPPKDIAQLVHWGDIFPGAVVVEAGVGSGALTLGLLRAVGESGKVICYDLRQDFVNLARKNIRNWPEPLEERLEIRLGNVHEELGGLRDVDRVILDLPDPWAALDGAAAALRPGGILMAYNPAVRQIDRLVMEVCDHREFRDPEVAEVIFRPWVADRVRLRPELRIVGHTGFLTRARRRSPVEIVQEEPDTPVVGESPGGGGTGG